MGPITTPDQVGNATLPLLDRCSRAASSGLWHLASHSLDSLSGLPLQQWPNKVDRPAAREHSVCMVQSHSIGVARLLIVIELLECLGLAHQRVDQNKKGKNI